MLIAYYNQVNQLITVEELARGARHSVSFELDEIFRRSFILSAKSFIAIHNHPVGGCAPSSQDLVVTKRMISRGKTLDIHMLDALIVDEQGICTSLRQTKAIDPWYPEQPWAHHGPAIAMAMLHFERNVGAQPDHIRKLISGPTIKLLLALYAHLSARQLQEICISAGLTRSTVVRSLRKLESGGLVASMDGAAKPQGKRYKLTDYGYAVTEHLLSGSKAVSTLAAPASSPEIDVETNS